MKCRTSVTLTLLAAAVALVVLAGPVSAQQARQNPLAGDWTVKTEVNSRQMESILSFARDQDGAVTGQWIGFGGVSALKDVKFEDGKLSFTRVMQTRDGQSSTSTFKGAIADGKLTGALSSERGESAVTGVRAPRMPRGAGIWDLKLKMGDRDVTATLTLGADKEGKLAGQWKSERGEATVSDAQFAQNKLTFKVKSASADRAWEANFEGTIQRNALTGTLKSERGESAVEGTRKAAALVGTWNLEVVSERGTRTQRFVVNPDLTGLYGALPIKTINFKDDAVDFQMTTQFGDQSVEMTFKGKLDGNKLTGEMTNSQGSMKITGTKAVRAGARRGKQQ
jgi:hypothetical protein